MIMDKMKIEIWSDIACPYCYIGKRKLELALAKFSHKDEIEIEWRSYELNPKLEKTPLAKSYYVYLAEVHGSSEEKARIDADGIVSIAKEVGLEYNFDRLVITNTSDALRVIKLAKQYNKADDAEELFFKAYFTDGKCISDKNVILEITNQLEIPADKVTAMLESDEFLKDIQEDIRYSENELNLQYIPFYLLNKKDIIQGSIEIDAYSQVLEKSYNDWKANGVSSEKGDTISGQACSIDGVCSI